MEKQIRIEVEEKEDATSKIIKPKRLSIKEMTQKIAERKEYVNSRGGNNILIPEVPKELKEQYAEEIEESHKTSHAFKSWKKMVKEMYQPSPEEIQKNWDDWWKTDALIDVANRGVKADNSQKRKQKIKDFFFIVSGCSFLRRVKYDRQQKKELNSMVNDFLNYIPLKDHFRNDEEPLSANMYNFIYYIIVYKQWRLAISPSSTYEILSKFKKQYKDKDAVLEHSQLTVKLLKDLYHFFRKKK